MLVVIDKLNQDLCACVFAVLIQTNPPLHTSLSCDNEWESQESIKTCYSDHIATCTRLESFQSVFQ